MRGGINNSSSRILVMRLIAASGALVKPHTLRPVFHGEARVPEQ
jgi:hypothetical protein